jgi:hypothetical protein
MVAPEHKQAIIPGNNGVFQSTVVHSGRVIATWKRTTTKTRTTVRVQPLTPTTKPTRTRTEHTFAPYAHYLSHPLHFEWVTP